MRPLGDGLTCRAEDGEHHDEQNQKRKVAAVLPAESPPATLPSEFAPQPEVYPEQPWRQRTP